MLDNIPFEVQVEIIKRLPVRSLIQFRSVSKAWKSLIDSSDFIARYIAQPPQHLLVWYFDGSDNQKCVSIVVDAIFPKHKVYVPVPISVNMRMIYSTMCSSHGLLCLYGDYRMGLISGTGRAVLWNPSIRKAVSVVVSNVTRAWRSAHSGNLPRNGFLYWLAIDRITKDNLIISFDMTSEEFTQVNLPKSLTRVPKYYLSMFNLKESLVVLERPAMVVWMMEDGVTKSFTKLFTVNVNTLDACGFRKPVTELLEDDFGIYKLLLSEPYSRRRDYLGIDGILETSIIKCANDLKSSSPSYFLFPFHGGSF
ncbi:hypothetical protein L1987_64708 [Smallanthus sonchifolius]|uniref:Uncharacterized protein n=1 Tax=Smallanthus sonchifolius TaxID=185202 RepID=A0ACB9BSG5_9ASTR|nr:hypothetical protein L1987_64708 [Smallanthus sonchifolius]